MTVPRLAPVRQARICTFCWDGWPGYSALNRHYCAGNCACVLKHINAKGGPNDGED